MQLVSKIKELLFSRPVAGLIILVLLIDALTNAEGSIIDIFGPKTAYSIIPIALIVVSAALFGIIVVRIIIDYLIRKPIDKLLTAENLGSLLLSYALFVFGILLLISFSYLELNRFGLGYLTYGKCTDTFSPALMESDSNISHDYFYFSAVTFFTIGYGDICPMGLSKYLSIVTVFMGNIVTVILMAIVITLYLRRKHESLWK
ncbi:MAG: ion channel [Candidatus Micrarchaeota archaeon]